MLKEFDSIIYHNNCPDGIFGLWCAYYYNKKNLNNDFNKIGISAGSIPYDNFTNQNIIFIDVCPSFEYIIEKSKTVKKITILDHHKSAYDEYLKKKELIDKLNNVEIIFDMKRSGCQIAWDYFFPELYALWFINYCADQDLWTWKLNSSKAINNAFHINNFYDENNLDKITELINYTDKDKNKLIEEGILVDKVRQITLTEQLEYSERWKMIFNDSLYNIEVGTIGINMKSEFGNLLANKNNANFGVIWNYSPKENIWYISLRGHDNSPDLSIIAKHFGGGGHAKAAAFRLNENPFGYLFYI
jgi:nanoRNase/pAp phosphatase (c-di-AMP/oligoRNAs hydrolase)